MSKIEIVVHPYALETLRARADEAIVTGQHLIERPFWFRNKETGQLYYDLFGCIGMPTEVSDKDDGQPGYVAVIAILKPTDESKPVPVADAAFRLMVEGESRDVPSLLDMIISMRKEYGFGLHPDLLQAWFGDPDRFITMVGLRNERLISAGGDRQAIVIIPPNDFYQPKSFDAYVRSLHSVLVPGKRRLFLGGCDVLRKHLRLFRRDNPAVMAVGGLVHTLLAQCEWADSNREAAFTVDW
jgi:hypothetical protein